MTFSLVRWTTKNIKKIIKQITKKPSKIYPKTVPEAFPNTPLKISAKINAKISEKCDFWSPTWSPGRETRSHFFKFFATFSCLGHPGGPEWAQDPSQEPPGPLRTSILGEFWWIFIDFLRILVGFPVDFSIVFPWWNLGGNASHIQLGGKGL